MFLLNHWCQLNLSEIPADKTCTSLPQSWGKPRGEKIAPEPVMKCTFVQAKTDQEGKRKRNPISCKLYDARSKKIAKQGWESERVMNMCSQLGKDSNPPPFSYLLSDQECSSVTDTVVGSVPAGSYLSYQLFDQKGEATLFTIDRPNENMIINDPDHSIKTFPQLPMENKDAPVYTISSNLEKSQIDFLKEVALNLRECWEVEKLTVLQSMEPEWMRQRCKRLTASNFGKPINRKKPPTEPFLRDIFCPKDLSKVSSIRHGRQQELIARSIYSKKMQKQCKKFIVYDAGLIINPSYPYLGASPDGKVYDPTEKEPFGLLEIKNPFKWRNCTFAQACEDRSFYLQMHESKPKLKQDHSSGYYAQVQGQLAVSGLTWCDFVVHLSSSHQVNVERIYFNKKYWEETLFPKLKNFYFDHGLPFLVYMRSKE